MGMQGGSGKGGGFNTHQFIGFDPFVSMPIGPVGGRTSGKANTGMVGGFSDIHLMRPRPSLQQQYAGLNAGVRGFEPLGIRGYTPPVYAQPMQSYGGFNPFGFNSFQGNPFRNPRRLPFLGPVTPPIQPTLPSEIPNFNNAFAGQLDVPLSYDQQDRQNYERQEMEDYQAPPTYETQVVQGGRDIVNRINPPIVQPVEPVTQPIQTPVMPSVPSVQQPLSRQDYERLEMGPNINVGKAGGGRVQGFNVGGMPEQNQTGDRLEEETIMALMGKHPNPKEVFNRYLEAYGEDGLLALAAEVEKMMSSEGRMIDGPGGGVDDFVPAIIDNMQPAALSKDEYVIPADVVAHAGDGSSEAGGKKFDELVARVRKAKTGNATQPEQIEFEEQIQSVT
jgi:hypothetical protein